MTPEEAKKMLEGLGYTVTAGPAPMPPTEDPRVLRLRRLREALLALEPHSEARAFGDYWLNYWLVAHVGEVRVAVRWTAYDDKRGSWSFELKNDGSKPVDDAAVRERLGQVIQVLHREGVLNTGVRHRSDA